MRICLADAPLASVAALMSPLARVQQLARPWVGDHPQVVISGGMAQGPPSADIPIEQLSTADHVRLPASGNALNLARWLPAGLAVPSPASCGSYSAACCASVDAVSTQAVKEICCGVPDGGESRLRCALRRRPCCWTSTLSIWRQLSM